MLLIRFHLYYISVCVMPVCTLFGNLLRDMIARNKYPECVPRGNITKSETAALAKDIFSVAVYKFRDISRNAFDNIVISAFMGLIVLSNYQNYYTVLTVPIWLLRILYVSVLPSVGNFAISNGKKEVYGVYKKNVFIMSLLAAWCAIGFCFLIQEFIVIWLGAEFRLSWVAVILFSIYIYLHGEAMIIKIMRESIGLWGSGRIWAAVEMALNLILNIVLIRCLGVEGIILATIISMLFISIPIENRIIFGQYFVGEGSDKIKSMFINAVWAVCTALVVGMLCQLAPNLQYISFAYKLFVCVLIPPLSCAICFYKTDEFKFVRDIIMVIVNKCVGVTLKHH